ncbi:hypothetical protein K7432_007363 [Basidiobolus ranarum]|uniref:cytidine deaminase n=1 Tax=Basidiobolus ranarum TaxID=34480 RepID=A0ABR2W081_9FUNG
MSSSSTMIGRPRKPIWDHFRRGERCNKSHYHAHCNYCIKALGINRVPGILGIPRTMAAHLRACQYTPEEVKRTFTNEQQDDRPEHKQRRISGPPLTSISGFTSPTSTINISAEQINQLIDLALEARENSYVPYSNFKVGAALLTDTNNFYKGCNVENASLGAGICAERAAFSRALTDGEKKFVAVAIATDSLSFTFPCGICRQFMAEWGTDLDVYVVKTDRSTQVLSLEELLPHRFTHR